MSDDNGKDEPSVQEGDSAGKDAGKWSTGVKVGAAIGSAAIAAALIYAGRHQMRKHDDFKAAKGKPLPKYENEPDYDEDGDSEAANKSEET
ncbi:hypothetical protein [Sphingorhabdus sp. 109]|jgi:hypothetical protein|uniref:hypothetical protein n=1 Tax=Sphingorhabdus sp. 109 TaxID=2653173 RepID=UPI0012F38836|nr:hypothetical protein [Sphingorhabdus sp. 109]VWX59136.1 conserved hypothetical protein [Sphingorhabdus sp. 109]